MTFLRRLWTEEPVLVRTILAVIVSAGVLTASQAAAWGEIVAALVALAGPASARAKVTPKKPVSTPTPAAPANPSGATGG